MEDQKYRDEEDLAEKLEGLKSKRCLVMKLMASFAKQRFCI